MTLPRVLLIAYHYPPLAGSSGVQRALRFAEYLPAFGWQPIVLSAATRAYENVSPTRDQAPEAPTHRAFALDTARHLSLAGRYPGCLARPDRWASWWLGAVPLGLKLIRRYRPAALWSTYPIATAHCIGATLQRLSGLPWIADFRDPMAHEGYPPDRPTWESFRRVEEKVFARARCATFTTRGTLALYRDRYGWRDDRLHLLENGYDEGAFAEAEVRARTRPPATGDDITLLHSGIVYPEWRNPRMLFRALRQLREGGHPRARRVRLHFRAPVHEAFLRQAAQAEGIEECIVILPELDYIDALAEMFAAGGLLVLQSAGCNDQVPAKVYEYLRTGRPIVALTDPQGDTAEVVNRHPGHFLADLESPQAIEEALAAWLAPDAPAPDPTTAADCSRRGRSAQLARILDDITH